MAKKRIVTDEGNNIPVCNKCVPKAVSENDNDNLHIISIGKSVTQVKADGATPPNYGQVYRGAYISCDTCALFVRSTKWCSLYSQDVEPNFICDSFVEFSYTPVDVLATANAEALKQLSKALVLELEKPSDNQPKYEMKIKAVDEKRHIVSGPVLVPAEMDLQGDIAPEEEIEDAAFEYLKSYRALDEMHDHVDAEAAVVESVVLKTDTDFYGDGDILAKGTWLMSVEVWGETWEAVKSGDRNGFSIDGTALAEAA